MFFFRIILSSFHRGVSKNNGTPKSSILIGFSIINHPFGVPHGTPIFGNTHTSPKEKSHFLLEVGLVLYVSRPAEDTQLPEQLPLALATAAAWRFWRFVDLREELQSDRLDIRILGESTTKVILHNSF